MTEPRSSTLIDQAELPAKIEARRADPVFQERLAEIRERDAETLRIPADG